MTTEEAIKTLREYDRQHIVYTPGSEGPIKIISVELLEHFERYQAGKEDIYDYPYIDTIIVQYVKKTLKAKEIEDAETRTDKTAQKNEKAAQHRWLVRWLEAFAAEGCIIWDFFKCCSYILKIEDDNNSELIAFLCTKGIANTPHLINTKTDGGWTPLILASAFSTPEACKALIAAGADVNAKTDSGLTPLILAVRKSEEISKALIAAGADVNGDNDLTVLMIAAADSTAEVCKALIEAGADVNAKNNNDGRTPLTCACTNPTGETVKILIEAGADVNAKDNGGWTPLMFAARDSTAEACKALIAAGADVNAKRNDGGTPLIMALYRSIAEVCKALIEAGADVNTKVTLNGKTLMPLDFAAYSGNDDIVDLLLKNGAEVRLNDLILSEIRDATTIPSKKEQMIKDFPPGKHRYQEVLNLLEAKINQ